MTRTPKVFISYSWTTPAHEAWVVNLAERLMADGIEVVIDKWDLKEGHDKYEFMESMVKSAGIDKVLIILDKKYSEKAEQRAGGVGTETQIISPEVYSNVSQEKFIPIISERDEDGSPYVPTYLKSRIYIDLSDAEKYEENYEKLIRNIHQRPAYTKPSIGKPPSYLFEDTPMTHKTSIILRSFDNQVAKNPRRINTLLQEFLDEFFENLKGFSITTPANTYLVLGKQIYDNLNSYTPLRNDFIAFFEKLTKQEHDFDIDILIRFLEKLGLLEDPLDDNRGGWTSAEFENFKFIIHELFLYLIAVGLKNTNYKFIEELFHSRYILQRKYRANRDPEPFIEFHHHIESMDQYYKQAFSQNFLSPMADFLVKRLPEAITKNQLAEADLLCHYIALLNGWNWFPITYVYKENHHFEFFDRLVSARHFAKVKSLLNVNSPEELKTKIENLQAEQKESSRYRYGYSNSHSYVTPIHKLIEVDRIATTR